MIGGEEMNEPSKELLIHSIQFNSFSFIQFNSIPSLFISFHFISFIHYDKDIICKMSNRHGPCSTTAAFFNGPTTPFSCSGCSI